MDIETANDSLFEGLFRQAVIDNFLEELDSLPADEELAKIYVYSPEHEAGMKKLFSLEARKERIRNIAKWSRRAAAVLVIAVAVLFGVLMSAPQVRASVIDTIVEWYEKYTKFTSNAPDTEKPNLEPGYIPIGFWENNRIEMETITIIEYINNDNEIITFQSYRASGSVSVDNEEIAYWTLGLDGMEYHLFASTDGDSENTIIWDVTDQRYKITSAIHTGELLEMAISVVKK